MFDLVYVCSNLNAKGKKDIYAILKNVGPLVLNGSEWEVKSKYLRVVLQKSRICFEIANIDETTHRMQV
jgi:hypothetical protein